MAAASASGANSMGDLLGGILNPANIDPDEQKRRLAGLAVPNIPGMPEYGSGQPTLKPTIAAPPPASSPSLNVPPVGALPNQDAIAAHQKKAEEYRQEGSGVSQIQNPLLRGLSRVADIAGSALFPAVTAMIPGTTLHNRSLIAGENSAANTLQSQQKSQLGAEEDQARTKALANPKPDNPEQQFIDEETKAGKSVGQAIQDYTDLTNKTQDKGVTNPQEGYAQAIAEVLKRGGDPNTDPHVLAWKAAVNSVDKQNFEEQTFNEWKQTHPDGTRMQFEKERAANNQAPERPPQAMVLVPDGKGGQTAQVVKPGSNVAPGSMTVQQGGSLAAGAAKDQATENKAAESADAELALMKQFAATPSPTNDTAMLMHYIGATKPESMGKIRLNQNEIELFKGTRSSLGDLNAALEKVQSGESLTPTQRQDMIATMELLSKASHRGGSPTPAGGNGQAVRKFNPTTGKLE